MYGLYIWEPNSSPNLGWLQYQSASDEKSKDNMFVDPHTLGVLARGHRMAKSKDRKSRNCVCV